MSWWGFLMVSMDQQGHREHKLLSTLLPEMPLNPSKPCQEPTLPYAYPSEVMEDRSELIGVHDGSKGILVVKLRRVRKVS